MRPSEEALTRNVRTLRAGLVVVAVVSLGIVFSLALLLVWRQYENAKSEAAQELRTRAILASTVFDTYFAGQLAALSAIVSRRQWSRGTRRHGRYFAASGRAAREPSARASAGSTSTDVNGRRATLTARSRRTLPTGALHRRPSRPRSPSSARSLSRRHDPNGRIIVMSVPTRDARGIVMGVLAGGIVLTSPTTAIGRPLGYEGSEIIDREGQLLTVPTSPDRATRPRQAVEARRGGPARGHPGPGR